MENVPVDELGLLGALVGALYLVLRWEISRKVSGSEAPHDIHERIVRLEERLDHLVKSDVPEFQNEVRCVKKELKDLNNEIIKIRGDVWVMKER